MDYSEAIKQSKCFGVAFDSSVRECKICEVAKLCKQKSEGIIPVKEEEAENKVVAMDNTPKAATRQEPKDNITPKEVPVKEEKVEVMNAEKPKKPAKPKQVKNYSQDMPDFKKFDLDGLLKLAEEKGISPSVFDKYTSSSIKKMRIIMSLKALYEVK